MLKIGPDSYDNIVIPESTTQVSVVDHLGGFDSNYRNIILNDIANKAVNPITIFSEYIFDNNIKNQYPNLNLLFKLSMHVEYANLNKFYGYKNQTKLQYKNFICSFNGSLHVGRILLVAIIKKFGWFDPNYVSKNFVFEVDQIDGHIKEFVGKRDRLYRKFFVSKNSEEFFQMTNSFGHIRFDHANNIHNLETKLTESFLHVVSESSSTSYYPFYGEKFLYSVVTKGLFLANAQPNWHRQLEIFYGFKKYDKIFDYRFDSIENPIERLIELFSMISKFENLSTAEWHDLYLMEYDTIQYNYNHYYSKEYIKKLERYV